MYKGVHSHLLAQALAFFFRLFFIFGLKMAALHFGFKLPGEDGSTANTNNKGKRARNNDGGDSGILYTQEGVDVAEALKAITVTLGHMDMRTRSLEAAAYITIESVPDNEFVMEALKGTMEFNEMIAKANRERWTKLMKQKNRRSVTICGIQMAGIDWSKAHVKNQ